MSSKLKGAILFLTLTLVFVLIVSQDSEFTLKWKAVQFGESSLTVREKLGDPYKNQEKFDFWIMDPHEQEALNSGAIYFITWKGGIDTLYIAGCLLYTSPSPRDLSTSRMPSSA